MLKKPILQKILLVVLLSGVATVIFVHAATNVGSNISTDGMLTVTGTTTLSSVLNVNDINISLNTNTEKGISISATAGTGIYFDANSLGNWGGYGIYFEGYPDDHNPFIYANVGISTDPMWPSIGIDIDWVGTGSIGYLANYVDGIGFKAVQHAAGNSAVGFYADFSNTSKYGKAVDIDLGNTNDVGVDISGTAGTGIETTRPISILDGGITFGHDFTKTGIQFYRDAGDSQPWLYGNLGVNSIGIDIDWVATSSTGFFANYIEGVGFKAKKGQSGAVGYLADWTKTSVAGTAIDIDLGNASDVGIDISGTLGTGIQTTRPIKIASSTMGTSEYPLEVIIPVNGYGLTFSGNLSGVYGIYFPGNISGSEAIIIEGNVTNSNTLSAYGNVVNSNMVYANGHLENSAGLYFNNYLENSTGLYFNGTIYNGSKGIYIAQIDSVPSTSYGIYLASIMGDSVGFYSALSESATGFKTILSSASSTSIDISGVTGTGIKTTRPIDFDTMSNKPTCDATARGQIFYVEGGAGVADTVEICTKDLGDAYAWRTLQ